MIDLSIIIVNYNVKEFLLNLLDSLQRATKNISSEIIVIDNNSQDKSVTAVKEKYPSVNLIESKTNLGFGGANNLGLEKSKGKYILLINPDTIVKEDTFEKLIEFVETKKDLGMVGCKVLNPDGTIQLACRRGFPGIWTSFSKVFGLSRIFPNSKLFAKYNLTYLDENKSYEVDAISGAFMFLKREVYKKIGGFDPQFFMYGEDLDLCYRTKKAGYAVYYFHETEVIHYKGESTRRSSIDETKVFYEAMSLFVEKNLGTSFFVNMILKLGITMRKLLAFLNANKLIVVPIILDFSLYVLSSFSADKLYDAGYWPGFPAEVKPWIYIIPAAIQIMIGVFSGNYKKDRLSIFKSILIVIVGFGIISGATFFFKQWGYSRAVVLITFAIFLSSTILYRLILKLALGWGFQISKYSKTLVIGTTQNAIRLASKIKKSSVNMFKVVGLAANGLDEVGDNHQELKVVTSIDHIKKYIAENKIGKVIVPSDTLPFNKTFSIVNECKSLNVDFMIAGDEQDYLVGKSNITLLDDISLLKVEYQITSSTNRIAKRSFDLIISFPLLVIFFPFTLLINVKKKKTSFLTLVKNIPSVISGRLSLVGPREEKSENGLYYGKPGLTGLWFTEANEYTNEEENKLNIFYAKNQNIWLDLEILGKTLSKIFTKRSNDV